ncbi:MAG: cysteate synthase [Methanocorpusculum sp.]|nr:cysteate synthase [Methanocorpusculum sp.]MDE2522930.1 cysteate synthase [Methanocorpusculum sp.]MDE2523505.1 cysteate synthase [Methanocorpusculum sp.]
MGDYTLRCVAGGETLPEQYTLSCREHAGLIRTEYAAKQLTVRPELPGIFRYIDWLPVHGTLPTRARPVTFRSESLCRELGLPNLWVTFTGYYPERDCFVATGSFKELEALPTTVRLAENGGGTLVVASAGNTGRGFAQMAAEFGTPVIIVVPESSAKSLWTVTEPKRPDAIKLITVRGDYTDAIAVANRITERPGYVPEGGAKNVARRDGMGTVMLDAAVTIGRMPDHYFQAVGSGTGGIAAWEASMRLESDGRFGSEVPRLHLAQNLPFTPMVNAWKERRSLLLERDMPDAAEAIAQVSAPVLTNRAPPYSMPGGVFEAMMYCGGDMYAVSNADARDAGRLFSDAENGIDLDPAAAVATAALISAVNCGAVDHRDTITLNITGGGYARVREELGIFPVPVTATVNADEVPEV